MLNDRIFMQTPTSWWVIILFECQYTTHQKCRLKVFYFQHSQLQLSCNHSGFRCVNICPCKINSLLQSPLFYCFILLYCGVVLYCWSYRTSIFAFVHRGTSTTMWKMFYRENKNDLVFIKKVYNNLTFILLNILKYIKHI